MAQTTVGWLQRVRGSRSVSLSPVTRYFGRDAAMPMLAPLLVLAVAAALGTGLWLFSPFARPTGMAAVVDVPSCAATYWSARTGDWPSKGRTAASEEDTILPTDTVSTYFYMKPPTAYANDSLVSALGYTGGDDLEGGRRLLLRSAVAALLSAADNRLNYPLHRAEFVKDVKGALVGTSRSDMLTLAARLEVGSPGCL